MPEISRFHELVWITSAKAMDDYRLLLTFNNGSRRIFDCLPLIEGHRLFAPLRDKGTFADFRLDPWTVTWLDGKLDIAPEYLYEKSIRA